MRTLTILIAAFTFCCKTLGQTNQGNTFTTFIIDTTLNSTLAKAKLKSEFNLPMVADGFWYFIDKKNFKEFVSKTGDPTTFFDTLQTLTNVVCDCMIKKDTIYLQGGIAYGGGMGFDLKIIGNLFNGKIWLAGKGYRTNKSSEFVDEILLNSVKQALKIQSRDSLRFDKKMIGEVILESENYFEKDDRVPNKFYLKVLFGCKLDDVIVL